MSASRQRVEPPIASVSDALAIETLGDPLLEVLSFIEVAEFGERSGHGKWSTVSKAFLAATSALVVRGPDFEGGAAAITSAARRFPSLTAFDLTAMSMNRKDGYRGARTHLLSFPESIVCAMTKLKTLNLSGHTSDSSAYDDAEYCNENKFITLRDGSGGLPDFSNLVALTTLGVGRVGIQNERELLPIRCLVSLTDLDLSNNGFGSLPDWIGELTELVTLDLNHCSYLYLIPPNIGNLRKLKHLYVELHSWDAVGSACLPDEICSLASLEVLRYWAAELQDDEYHDSNDRLTSRPQAPALPDAIGMLTGLKDLRFCSRFPHTDAVEAGLAALRSGGCEIQSRV